MIVALATTIAGAQTKPAMPAMPDINKLMKMSPAELEAYKKNYIKQAGQQAATYARENNLVINENLIPGYELKQPVKDVKRLSLIPSRPPTRTELVAQVQESIQQIQTGIPAPRVGEIQKYTASTKLETIHEAAIASFYGGDPKEGMMLMMMAAKNAPDSLLMLNNLGAMFNMVGVEQKAVPLLQYCLERLPNSSIVLNNIGQSFMGLGDMLKAASYLNRCLELDSLNVEANHTMGMLHMFKKEYDAAMKCFNRELSIAMRRSTMAHAQRMGRKFNLGELMRQKQRRSGREEKNFFEEINLGKFSFPNVPGSAKEIVVRKREFAQYATSVQAEYFFWQNNATKTGLGYTAAEGQQRASVYEGVVDVMLEQLNEEFNTGYLINFTDSDHRQIREAVELASHAIIRVQCPKPEPGSSLELQKAFEVKCCEEIKLPIANKMVEQVGTVLGRVMKVGQQRWKSYINQLIAIVQLNPSRSNQMLVYNAVAGYFNYLSLGMTMLNNADFSNLLVPCDSNYDKEELERLLESDRAWRLDCPAWANIELQLQVLTLKADCSKYQLEGGAGIMAGYEHEFKTGKSTLLLGPGAKVQFFGKLLTAEVKSQLYISFDNNKEFADFGIKNSGELSVSGTPLPIKGVKVGGNAMGIEVSNTMGIISGYGQEVEYKGGMAKLFDKK